MPFRVLLLTAVSLFAAVAAVGAEATRPRIGVVLSGGGARGTAHIGVLKVLDELHVPVDVIAGTSMGAVVGGLYASGMSAAEIEQLFTSLDWQDAFRDRPRRAELSFRRKQEDLDFLVNVPLGYSEGRLKIPSGLIQGQKLTQVLRQATLPVAHINSFDQLATRFRAVATDLETGEAVIIDHGDLTSAMRASMSAPGVFAPVEREGRVLVDGGLVKNLPVDVARELGVDVLIVVDASAVLLGRNNLDSLPSVSNQALAIMMRRDLDAQRAQLDPARDVLLTPDLTNVSSYNFVVANRAIGRGEIAARAAQAQLVRYAADAATYERYMAARRSVRGGLPMIEFVRNDSANGAYQRQISDIFADQVGQPLDPEALRRDVTTLYGRGNLETLDYHLVEDAEGRKGLAFDAQRNSWGPDYLRLGLSLQDDFEGNTSFDAAARLVFTELNSLDAEALVDLQVGASPHLGTELYLPLSNVARYFVAPHAQLEAHDVPQNVYDASNDEYHQIGEFRVRSFDYGLDAGREFGRWGELRGGLVRSEGSTRVKLGDFTTPNSDFKINAAFVRLAYDRLDSVNFPRSGQQFQLQWRVEDDNGDDLGTDLVTADWTLAFSRGRNTGIVWLSGGSTVGGYDRNVRTWFPLGGFLNLSGLRADSLAGPHYAIGRSIYLRQVGRGGEGVLNVPAYVGLSLEFGNVWSQRSDMSFSSARTNGSLFFGADTYIGPTYLAVGYDESGDTAFYLFLGRSF